MWQRFHDQLTDPRAPRGRHHLLSTFLTIAAVATVAGENGPKGFPRFAGELSQPQRRHLRCRPHPPTDKLPVPSEPTFRRAFKRLDQVQFHAVLTEWLAAHDPEKYSAVAVDGKTVKCSRQKAGRPVHLMSAVTHRTHRLLNQIPVAEKSNEIPAFRPLLESLPLAGVLVTADAEHCQRAHARFLVYEKDADDLVLAKGFDTALLLVRSLCHLARPIKKNPYFTPLSLMPRTHATPLSSQPFAYPLTPPFPYPPSKPFPYPLPP